MALWLDSDWKKRTPVVIDMGGAVHPGDPDRKTLIDLSLYPFWDAFWEHIDVLGADIVATAPDGATLLHWSIVNFNKVLRQGALTIEYSVDATYTTLTRVPCWIYWESASTKTPAATSGATTTTTHKLSFEGAGYATISGNPTIEKPAGESQSYAFLSPDLAELCAPSQGSTGYEALREIAVEVLDGTGAPVPAMVTPTEVGVMQCARSGTTAIKAPITGGTQGVEYTIRVTLKTTLGRVLLLTATLSVT